MSVYHNYLGQGGYIILDLNQVEFSETFSGAIGISV